MRTPNLLLIGILAIGSLQAQNAADNSWTDSFNSATPGPAHTNKPTTLGGSPGANAWVVEYWTNGASGVSVQIEGAPDVSGSPGSYTKLTAATSPIASANPATGTTSGIILACCDYYPWIRINVTVFTGTSQSMTVRVYGYKSPTQVAGGGSGGNAITGLTQDVLATGPGVVPGTVVGIDTVPLCSGFAPTNGQVIQYTTGGSPSPCYGAATVNTSAGKVIGTANFDMATGAITKLHTGGVVSGITYVDVGKFTVSLSPSQTNFSLSLFAADTGAGVDIYVPGTSTPDFSASTSSISVFVLNAAVSSFINSTQVSVSLTQL